MPKPPQPTTYMLVIAAGEGGTTVPAPGVYQLASGFLVNLSASPYPGYHFLRWQGDVQSDQRNVQLVMDGNISVTALFEAEQQPVQVEAGSIIPALGLGLTVIGILLAYSQSRKAK